MVKKYGLFRTFKNGKLAKAPKMVVEAADQDTAWAMIGDDFIQKYPESSNWMLKIVEKEEIVSV